MQKKILIVLAITLLFLNFSACIESPEQSEPTSISQTTYATPLSSPSKVRTYRRASMWDWDNQG